MRVAFALRPHYTQAHYEKFARTIRFSKVIPFSVFRNAAAVSARFKAHCALLLCSFLWGVTFVVVKDTLVDISVFAYLAARFTLGALPLAWYYRADIRKLSRSDVWAGIQVGLFMFGGYAFQTAGIARTTPSKAAFITGLSVILIPVFLAIVWRRRINAWAWAGVLASFAGLYFLTVPREGLSDLNRGDLLVMGCAVLYAMQIIFIDRLSMKHSLGGLSFLQVAVTAVLSLLAVPMLDAAGWESVRVHFTPTMVFGVVVTAIFTTALAYPLLVWGQHHTSATSTALILASEPVFAAVTSFFLVHERLGGRPLAGAGLILAGILIAELKGHTANTGANTLTA
ncbi:MAG TPA: DMT family transporter [Candidatus Dormibacteraeota bacterium]|nr:DMT family transporter [Candidatus Dormibacteraeota bacterium]